MRKCKLLIWAFLLLNVGMSLPAKATTIPETTSVPYNSEPEVDSIHYYLNSFNNLSRKERKARIKEAKKFWKTHKLSDPSDSADSDIVFLAILAILIPPLAVYLKEKAINKRFWITLLLWFLFILPGIVFALLIVFGVI